MTTLIKLDNDDLAQSPGNAVASTAGLVPSDDNCGRENKNRFVLALCCLLVELGIFRKIKISFLMVGHTHEDVDQVFSKFSGYLLKHTALTIDKLLSGFSKCYSLAPHGVELKDMFDISNWLLPNLNSISMHSKPHVFKITLNEHSKACIWFRKIRKHLVSVLK
jgi:thioester reductase-like protein